MRNTNNETKPLCRGTRVRYSGYEGTIIRLYNDDPEIYEVRVPGGVTAIGRSSFKVMHHCCEKGCEQGDHKGHSYCSDSPCSHACRADHEKFVSSCEFCTLLQMQLSGELPPTQITEFA